MTPDHVTINRGVWEDDAASCIGFAERRWNFETPVWGNWGGRELVLRVHDGGGEHRDRDRVGVIERERLQ